MEQIPTSDGSGPEMAGAWKIAVYFVVLAILSWLGGHVFHFLSDTGALSGFDKASQLLSELTDFTKHRDDSIVTVWSLSLTFLLVFPIAWTYSITKPKWLFDPGLAQTLIVMGMIVCGMMMIIQDNFSRALALVGAVSAVRFRTSLKDPKDALFLLVSIAIGMGTGLRVYRIAMILMPVMCIVFLVLWKFVPEHGALPPAALDGDKKAKKKDKAKDDPGVPASAMPGIDEGGLSST